MPSKMTRRTLLATLPASGAAMAHAHSAQAPETLILRLFREQQSLKHAADRHVSSLRASAEQEEYDRLFYNRLDQIEAQMMALPCTCAADMAAKMIAAHGVEPYDSAFSCLHPDAPVWIEARWLTMAS